MRTDGLLTTGEVGREPGGPLLYRIEGGGARGEREGEVAQTSLMFGNLSHVKLPVSVTRHF